MWTKQCDACTNLMLTDVVISNTEWTEDTVAGTELLSVKVDNGAANSTVTFSGTFTQSLSTTDAVSSMKSTQNSQTYGGGGTITFKSPKKLTYVTGSAAFEGSYTMSGSRTVGKSAETTSSTTVETNCGVTVPPGNCVTVSTTMLKGTVTCTFTATATCPTASKTGIDRVDEIESDFQVDDLYVQATYAACHINDCVSGTTLDETELAKRGITQFKVGSPGRGLGERSAAPALV